MLHCSNGVVQPNDYVPKFGKISVKFSVLGVVCPYRFSPMGLQFGMEEWTEWTFGDFGPLLHGKFHPIGGTCRHCGAKKLKIAL